MTVTVSPGTLNACVRVKAAEIAVKLPGRGTEKASFIRPVKSIVVPRTTGLGMAVPNPMKKGIPTNPPTREVKATGTRPEANGIIEPVFAGGIIQAASIAVNGPTLHLIIPVSVRKQPELLREDPPHPLHP